MQSIQKFADIGKTFHRPAAALAAVFAMLFSLGCVAQTSPGFAKGPAPGQGNIKVVRSIDGDSYMVGPKGDAEVKFKLHKEDTGNLYEVITEDHPKGFKSEPHIHPVGAETFLVIYGTYEYQIGDQTGIVHAGDVMHVPPNTIHVIHALEEGRVLMVYSPPGIEERTKALTSMTPEQMAIPGAVAARLAEYGHVGVPEE